MKLAVTTNNYFCIRKSIGFLTEVLTWLFELQEEVRIFLLESSFQFSDCFNKFSWLAKLAYLADIFSHLNGLNLSLQGKSVDIFTVQDKVEAMIKQLSNWCCCLTLKHSNYKPFPSLLEFLTLSEEELTDEIKSIFSEHLQSLQVELHKYFPVPDSKYNWINNPFADTCNVTISELTSKEEDSLLELCCDGILKAVFVENNLMDFWL